LNVRRTFSCSDATAAAAAASQGHTSCFTLHHNTCSTQQGVENLIHQLHLMHQIADNASE
jgi:hypothetical protein